MIKFKKIEFDIKERLEVLPEVFKLDERIAFAYLFGSCASGKLNPLSDIDIAYLAYRDVDFNFEDELELLGKINEALKTDEVDLALLNNAPLSFRYEVISNGKLLFCRSRPEKEIFESETIMNYLDFKPIRDEYFGNMFSNIKEG